MARFAATTVREMNERSATRTSNGSAPRDSRVACLQVAALHHDDSLVTTELRCELSVAHVYRPDTARSAFQEAVRESSRRRPGIEACPTIDDDAESLERGSRASRRHARRNGVAP